MKHTISALVENEFGVLTRIAGLFSGRGYNIQSLTVAETLDPHVSRMTIVTSGNDAVIDQINKQLSKLVNVIKVRDMTSERAINRILALVKVKLNETNRNEVIKAVETIGGEVLDVEETYCVVEVRGDEEKIVSSVNRLMEEDPTLSFNRDRETKEMILSGMGQVHIEVTIEKMKRKFGVEVNLKTPKVPYKETIKGKTNVQGKYKKQSGGRGQFGDCWLDIEPLPRGGGFEFADKIVGGVIPQQYRPAVQKGIVEAMQEGILAGYPVVDLKVSLVDVSYHTVDSSEMAFKIAGSMGFKKGVLACQPTLLEPIVHIFIEIPEEYLGDVIGDLNSRRGRVQGMDSKGSHQIVKGQVPLAEILKYAPDLRSMTSGRGTFTYEHSHYEEAPPYIAEKIIAESKKEEG